MRSSPNPYLKRISSLVGEQDTSRAVQLFVKGQRSAGDSLEGVARKLGVHEIIEERLPFEGGLFRATEGRLVVKLNSHSSFARKRFTLAHEIGHLILGTIPGLRGGCRSNAALERACDFIAAELVMPTEEAIPFVRTLGSPSPEKLTAIASKYGVSLHVAAIRVHNDFRLWKCLVGLWEQQAAVRTIWFVGPRRRNTVQPDSYSLQLALDSDRAVRTTELWPSGQFTDPVWLNLLHIGGNRILGLVAFAK